MYISRTRLLVLILLVVILLAGGVLFREKLWPAPKGAEILSFKDCVAAGYPVAGGIIPAACTTPDGRVFTDEFQDKQEKDNLIHVYNPQPDQEITSPLMVTGEARGTWYFEATFPIVLVDGDGRIIAEGHAEAQGEWMTENFVPFRVVLEFKTPSFGERGAVILRKSNPSGLPEHDDALEIPIRFKVVPAPLPETGRERGGCKVMGCSEQVCADGADGDVITTCEYRPEYACYENAVCERQADKTCGWTLTAAVGRCLMEVGDGARELQ